MPTTTTTTPAPTPSPAPSARGLYAGEPETCRRRLREFVPILLHLAVLVEVFAVFRVEGRGFQFLVMLAAVVLPAYYLLPIAWKKPAFVAASMAGLVGVFGLDIALWVVPAALFLIGLCYVPARWAVRVGLIGSIAAALALLRVGAGGINLGIPAAVWPVLGTMLMFRMILFLYELKHAAKPERPLDALTYFFMLPNYCFLHFPVVDYRTYQRGFFASDVHATMRRGLDMMTRGTSHLLLYRLVYHEMLIRPAEVQGPLTLAAFLTCNYLLYLRVSGQFHMACGMFHLFGFQLPETHRHYFLATGFTDYWRRINIYWKDFMVRVVFNPVVFRLKRWPQPRALAVATLTVFVTTWALHAYQSFWLKGRWGFSLPDALFWGILGLLVLVNVRNDARNPRRTGRRAPEMTPRLHAIRAAKVAGTFATLALLWSLWYAPSLSSWAAMLGRGVGL
jgi:hypothetical protein